MAGINFENLTPDNGAVRDLAELIFLEMIEDDKFQQLVTLVTGVKNGKKVGFVGKPGLLGQKSTGCDPTYENNLTPASEKTWAIAAWEIAEKICYEDLEGTLADYATANGTDKADLTSSDYMEKVVRPFLEQAIRDLLVRYIFFGDTDADGTTLKNAADAKYFNLIDGIWKQLFEGVTSGETKRVAIAANEAATIDAQYEAMRAAGAATGVLNDLIIRTPMKLRGMADRRFIVTQAFADMLNLDIQENNKGSNLQWESIFAGIQKTTYQGIELIAVPQLDEIIQDYLKNGTNANAYDKPFRVIYTSKANLRAGSESTDTYARVDVTFDKITRNNFIYAADTIGAMVLAEEYAAVAY